MLLLKLFSYLEKKSIVVSSVKLNKDNVYILRVHCAKSYNAVVLLLGNGFDELKTNINTDVENNQLVLKLT